MKFSLDDKHIAVMYHYIENPSDERSGIHPCPIEEFERQVKFLSENYRIVSLRELFEAVKNGSNEKFCTLTFDDGLKDQYQNGVPILKKYNATGEFFIIGSVLDGKIPFTHKVHTMLSYVGPEQLVDEFHNFLHKYFPEDSDKYRISLDKHISNERLHEDIRIANFKEVFITLPEEMKENFLDWIFEIQKIDTQLSHSELFMNEEEINNLEKEGFVIGNHSYSHRSFAAQDISSIQKDIQKAKERLCKLAKKSITSFCYPFGHLNRDINSMTSTLKEEGITHAVAIEMRKVEPEDSPFIIPRYDTNDIRDYLNENNI